MGRMRFCAVTRRVLPESELIRFVAAPDGSVVADLKAKLPGRGVWVGLHRSSVGGGGQEERLRARPEGGCARRVRSGGAGGGAIEGGGPRASRPGAEGGGRRGGLRQGRGGGRQGRRSRPFSRPLTRRKTAAGRWSRRSIGAREATRPIPHFRCFQAAELGLAMGRPNVIHAAVLQSPAGRSFVEAANRLQRYDGAGDGLADDQALGAAGNDG